MYPTTQPICVHMSSNVRACMSLPACGATPRKGGKGPARSCSCSESPPCPCSVVLVCYLQTQARMKVSHNCARRGRKEGGGVRACRRSLRRRLAGREGRDAGVRACMGGLRRKLAGREGRGARVPAPVLQPTPLALGCLFPGCSLPANSNG